MKNKSQVKCLSISKTSCEWKVITKKIRQIGSKNLALYIRKEIHRLKEDMERINIDCGDKIEKRPYLPLETLKIIEDISRKTKTPVSTIITKFIIDPLLSN